MATTTLGANFPVIITLTFAELQDLVNNSNITAGTRYFVTNRCDKGLWLVGASENTLREEGTGIYQDAVYQSQVTGDDSDISLVTGIPLVGGVVQWQPSVEKFDLFYINIANGPFVAGTIITDTTTGWQGTVVSDDGVSKLEVYTSLSGFLPGNGNTIDNGTTTAEVDSFGPLPNLQGVVFTWLDINSSAGLLQGYQLYQCIDDNALDGSDPSSNLSAYTLLHRRSFIIEYSNESGPLAKGLPASSNNGWTGFVTSAAVAGELVVYTDSGVLSQGDVITVGVETADVDSVGEDDLNLAYRTVACHVRFDYANDWVFHREEGSNKVVNTRITYLNNVISILNFPWGNPAIHDVKVEGGSYKDYNNASTAIGPMLILYGSVYDPVAGDSFDALGRKYKTVDISGGTADFASSGERLDFVTLVSSNSTETVAAITNTPLPGIPFVLKVHADLEVTFTGTAVANMTQDSICLPAASIVLDGAKGETAVFMANGVQTVYQSSNEGIL